MAKLRQTFSALLRFVGRLRLNRDLTNIYLDHHQRGRPELGSRESRPPAPVVWSGWTWRLTGQTGRFDTRNERKVCNGEKCNKVLSEEHSEEHSEEQFSEIIYFSAVWNEMLTTDPFVEVSQLFTSFGCWNIKAGTEWKLKVRHSVR